MRRPFAAAPILGALILCAAACAPDSGQDRAQTEPSQTEPPPGQNQTPPPNPERDPATRAPTADLPDAYLLHRWTAKGGDCGEADFAITENAAGGLIVQAALNGRDRTGHVRRAGPGGSDAGFVFDATELGVARNGIDGLAVRPPEGGEAMLGDQTLRGDGAVFIQCPPA